MHAERRWRDVPGIGFSFVNTDVDIFFFEDGGWV